MTMFRVQGMGVDRLNARVARAASALADQGFIAHPTPGGQLERLFTRMQGWQIPFARSGLSENC